MGSNLTCFLVDTTESAEIGCDFLELLNPASCWLLADFMHNWHLKKNILKIHDDCLSSFHTMFPTSALKRFSTKAVISFTGYLLMHTTYVYSEKDVLLLSKSVWTVAFQPWIKYFSFLIRGQLQVLNMDFLKLWFIFPLCAIKQ